MKLVLDEKLRHRFIGLAVVISLGAIFIPVLVKKPHQSLEKNFNIQVKLPVKPQTPEIEVKNEQELFKTIKVAKVSIPEAPAQVLQTVVAQSLKSDRIDAHAKEALAQDKIFVAQPSEVKHVEKIIKEAIHVAAAKPAVIVSQQKFETAKINSKAPAAKNGYAIQLASFSKKENAKALVDRLHAKGFKADFSGIQGKHGVIYKVFAGHSPNKSDAVKLRTELAKSMQLKGFIVQTRIS